MIKLERPSIPQILAQNQSAWKQALNDAIATYGRYANIPDNLQEKLVVHYRHEQIKTALISSSYEKCCYCGSKPAEGGSSLQVEHYEPKSLYPDRTFAWDNLLPACSKCNRAKYDHDTRQKPIVDPYRDDPAVYFIYDDIIMTGSTTAPDAVIAERTIKVCNLNRRDLYKKRSELLVAFRDATEELNKSLDDYENSTERKRLKIAGELDNCLSKLDDLMVETATQTGYIRFLLNNNPTITRARAIVEDAFVSVT